MYILGADSRVVLKRMRERERKRERKRERGREREEAMEGGA